MSSMTNGRPLCQFETDNGKHCVLLDNCIQCRTPQPPELRRGEEVTFSGFGELDGKYKIEHIKDGRLTLTYVKEPK